MNNQTNTLSECLHKLGKQGYTHSFEICENGTLQEFNGGTFSVNQVKLVDIYRFEGMTNPSDSSILYAIETITGLKGAIVDAYGVDGSVTISDFMNQLEQK
jgi:Leu/Phe-tRNA-protein transferase